MMKPKQNEKILKPGTFGALRVIKEITMLGTLRFIKKNARLGALRLIAKKTLKKIEML